MPTTHHRRYRRLSTVAGGKAGTVDGGRWGEKYRRRWPVGRTVAGVFFSSDGGNFLTVRRQSNTTYQNKLKFILLMLKLNTVLTSILFK